MRHRKETLFPSHLQRTILCNYALLTMSLFVLISCGGTTPSNQHISRPESPPALFVFSSQGDISAYHADGTSLWQASADTNSTSQPNLAGTHLIDTGRMIIVATDAVRAYSRTGELRWQHDLPYRTDDSLLVGSTLYIAGGGTITAWDTLIGILQWQQATVPGTSLASDTHDLLVSGGNQVTAFNLQSGAKVWNNQGDPGEIIQALFPEGDILLIRTDGSLTAVQASTGKLIWHHESQLQSLFIDPATGIIFTIYIDVPLDGSPITSGLQALCLNTGTPLWNVSFPIKNEENGSISPTGIVWAGQTSITAWDLNGRQSWQIPYVGKPITQVISIERGAFFLLLAQNGVMTALDARTGQQRWQVAPGAGNSFQMIVQPTLIWLINQDTGTITAFDFNGKMRWSLNGPSSPNEIVIE